MESQVSDQEVKQERLRRCRFLSGERAAWEKYTLTKRDRPLTSARWSQRTIAAAQCVLSLYHRSNPNIVVEYCDCDERRWQDGDAWHEQTGFYYSRGHRTIHHSSGFPQGWSHIGPPHTSIFRSAAENVPYQSMRRDAVELDRLVFGLRDDKLTDPANAPMLPWKIKSWWHRHDLFIVPVDPTEKPITRWKCDAINPVIKDRRISIGDWCISGADLEGKELQFFDDNRPGDHFLFLAFLISLMRIRELKKPNWEATWTRYLSAPPFPTSEPYIRGKVLHSLATYWQSPGSEVLATWFKGNCFKDDLHLNPFEVKEVARLVFQLADEQEGEYWDMGDRTGSDGDPAE